MKKISYPILFLIIIIAIVIGGVGIAHRKKKLLLLLYDMEIFSFNYFQKLLFWKKKLSAVSIGG